MEPTRSVIEQKPVIWGKKCPLSIPAKAKQEKLGDVLDSILAETQCLESLYQSKLEALDELKNPSSTKPSAAICDEVPMCKEKCIFFVFVSGYGAVSDIFFA